MTEELQVVADGATKERPKKQANTPWLPVVLAFGLGLGLGVMFVSPAEEPDEAPAAGELAPPAVEPVPLVTDSGVAEVVDGFESAIVALADPGFSGFNRLLWAADAPLVINPAGTGSFPSLDRSGQIMAAVQAVPDLDGWVLSMGRSSSLEPIASGVTSYQFHDGKSGHLSYIIEDETHWQLWRVFNDLQPELVTEFELGLVDAPRIAAWGDWGWAIGLGTGEVLFLTPEGQIKTQQDGVALDSSPDGWVVVANERLQLVSAGGGVDVIDVSLDRIGVVKTAKLSPDVDMLALVGTETVVVVPIDDEGPVVEFEVAAEDAVWTSDGRFLLAPVGRGVSILDVVRGVRQQLLSQYLIVDVVAAGP